MPPLTLFRNLWRPDGASESATIAWEETPLGFEMRVTLNHQTTSYTFSTEEQLTRAVQTWKASVLAEGFKPFMRYSPEWES